MLLIVDMGQSLALSLTHKRWAQNEADKVVLDGELVSDTLQNEALSPPIETAFMQGLALSRQPQANLHALYQGWIECMHALQAAKITGSFKSADSPEQMLYVAPLSVIAAFLPPLP